MSNEISVVTKDSLAPISSIFDSDICDRQASEQLLLELSQAVEGSMVPIPMNGEKLGTEGSPDNTRSEQVEDRNGKRKSRGDPVTASAQKRVRIQSSHGSNGAELDTNLNGVGVGASVKGNGNGNASVGNESVTSLNGPRRRHKKFEEQEEEESNEFDVGAGQNGISTGAEPASVLEDSDGQDEAPETVTAAAALASSRATNARSDQLAEQQQILQRAKRKDLDARLKAQAKTSKYRKSSGSKRGKTQTPLGSSENVHQTSSDGKRTSKKSKSEIPLLLPEELLTSEPGISLLAEQPLEKSDIVNKRKKRLDVETKPLKDVRRGNTKIRVLQKQSSMLPPKASTNLKSLREAWLMGRRQKSTVKRQDWKRGFLKK